MKSPPGMKFTNVTTAEDIANNESRWRVSVESVVHICPPKGSGLTPCCERTPFELPRWDRLTLRAEDATCPARNGSEVR